MNKNELVSAVAELANLSKGDAQSAVEAVFSVITGELKKGGDVRLVGFENSPCHSAPLRPAAIRRPAPK